MSKEIEKDFEKFTKKKMEKEIEKITNCIYSLCVVGKAFAGTSSVNIIAEVNNSIYARLRDESEFNKDVNDAINEKKKMIELFDAMEVINNFLNE